MFGQMSRKASAALAALAVGALLAPSAMAQSYGYSGGYGGSYGQTYYDPCVRDQRQRQTAGGLVGAAIGAIAGSQIAARGRRTEGSVLGGALGAAIGAGVGHGQAACQGRGYAHDDRYSTPYGASHAYGSDPWPAPGRPYDDQGRRPVYDDRDHGRRDGRYADADADACRLAESHIRLPDGRTETRYVRTCPDSYGRYRVVD